MSAEGMPQDEDGLLARLLAWATARIVRHPLPVLAAAGLLAIVSVAYAAGWLEFRTSRLDLLNPRSDFNQLWVEYLEEFGDRDDAIVAIEGDSPEAIAPVKRELAQRLARESDRFEAVLHEVDLSPIRAKALHFLPAEQVRAIERFVAQVEPLARGDWSLVNFTRRVRRLNEGLQQAPRRPPPADSRSAASPARGGALGADDVAREVEQLSHHLIAALTDGPPPAPLGDSPLHDLERSFAALGQRDSDYLHTRDGWIGFVLLRFVPHRQGDHAAIVRLREILAETQARNAHLRIGLTGMPVLEDDEMWASRQDMSWANGVSFLGVALLFVLGFGSWRHPSLCLAMLLIGMAWSLGYITLAVGRLNLLSVAFGVILIGLGIDYGIHFATRYLHLRRAASAARGQAGAAPAEAALTAAARGVGPAILTGSATTALAFYAAGLTPFTGVAELGIIAGGGILLCCAAALLVLPALLAWADRRWPPARFPQLVDLSRVTRPAMRWPRCTLALSLGATLVLACGAPQLWYDHNLLHLQAADLESVVLERKLLEETDKSVWFAVSLAETPDELRRRKALFDRLPAVDRTEEIASLLAPAEEEKTAAIARLAERLHTLPEQPPWLDVDPPERLAQELAQLQAACAALGGTALAARLGDAQAALHGMTVRQYYQRLAPYQQNLAEEMLAQLRLLRSLADPQPPGLADLPPSLVARFVGRTNRHLLKVYGRGDIWEIENLEQFVRQVKSVDPRATGHPLQTYYASKQMQQSFLHAAIYALLAVAIVLMLDFGSVRHTLLALAPVALAMVQTFGILGWRDWPLNPANTIALPLLLGIGVDSGVHVMHDYRAQRGRYRLSPSTAVAVMLASLTTMVGFASLLLASHRGIRSLGVTLTIGMACCLVSSLAILPPLLALLRRDAAPSSPQTAPAAATALPAEALAPPERASPPVILRRRAA